MCWENIHNTIPKKGDSAVDSRCYELKSYEKESLKQIGEMAKEGYESKPELLKEHLDYLFSLIQRISGILEMERSVGAPTAELERDINNIKILYREIEAIKQRKIEI